MWSVGEVAEMSGISVRTLHHYDEIGLLCPSTRTDAGYRMYRDADVRRLQQILVFRSLGMPLQEIGQLLADPAFDVRKALLSQRQLLLERAQQAQTMLNAVEAALRQMEKEEPMNRDEMKELFKGFDPEEHREEAERKWSGPLMDESKRRTSKYTKKDWQQAMAEGERIHQALAAVMASGALPTDARAMDAAEAHRQHISRWFYPCSTEVHRGLGDMYVQDPRFGANYEALRPGLTQFFRDAIHANARRQGESAL